MATKKQTQGIGRNRVLSATANLPDRQREAIRWLHGYMIEKKLSLKALAKVMRCSDSSLSQLFSGKYAASLDNFVSGIEDLRKVEGQRTTVGKIDFVGTSLSKQIFKCCKASLTYQRIVFIFGASQMGKTRALEEFARRNADVVLVRMPEGGTLGDLLHEMATALGISAESSSTQLKRRIKAAFDDRMTLIVDEVHQCFVAKGGASRLRSIEFIREVYDRTKCGVVLSGTNIFRDEIQQGRHRLLLEQIDLRSIASLQLPNRPSTKDLAAFAAAHGLAQAKGEAETLQTKIIREHRLSRWLAVLQAATRVAKGRSEKIDWQHVLDAHAGLETLSKI